MSLGKRLVKLRGDRSQSEWSRQLDISQQNLSRWEADEGAPSLDAIMTIVEAEDVSLSWLVSGEESE